MGAGTFEIQHVAVGPPIPGRGVGKIVGAQGSANYVPRPVSVCSVLALVLLDPDLRRVAARINQVGAPSSAGAGSGQYGPVEVVDRNEIEFVLPCGQISSFPILAFPRDGVGTGCIDPAGRDVGKFVLWVKAAPRSIGTAVPGVGASDFVYGEPDTGALVHREGDLDVAAVPVHIRGLQAQRVE